MRTSVRLVVASLLMAAIASACAVAAGPTAPTPSAGSVGPSAPSVASSAVASSAVASSSVGPAGDASARPSASPSAVPAFACPPAATSLPAPSNRLTNVVVTPRDGYDEVAFVFRPGGSGSGVAPEATIQPARPPFTAGASGLPLSIDGDTFIALTLHDMIVADAGGSGTYAGPTVLRPSAAAVTEVVQAEAFEGVVRWIVGSRGPGCARVVVDEAGSRVLVDVQHA